MARRIKADRYNFPKELPADFPKPGPDGKIPNEVLVKWLFPDADIRDAQNCSDGIWRGLVSIGPSQGTRCIDLNGWNRGIRPHKVRAIKNDMLADQFICPTTDPIIFSWAGKVISGQHRLMAIIESGKNIEFMIYIGEDPIASIYVDQGTNRTVVDAMENNGVDFSAGRAKAKSRSAAYDVLVLGKKSTTDLGNRADRAETIQSRIELLEKVEKALRQRDSAGIMRRETDQPCRIAGCHAAFMHLYEAYPEIAADIAEKIGNADYTPNSVYGVFEDWARSMNTPGALPTGRLDASFSATVCLICNVAAETTVRTKAYMKATKPQMKNFLAGKPLFKNDSYTDAA